jgi:hypothetical protein
VSNRRYKINESFEVIGGFWDSTASEDKFGGTLSSKNGRLTLVTAPVYDSVTFDPSEFVNATSNVLPKVEGMCGFTQEGDCSLLALVMVKADGLTDYSTGREVVNKNYRVSAAVMGLHVHSLDAKTLDAAAFYFSKIHYLLPNPWGMEIRGEENTFIAPLRALDVFEFRSASLAAKVICEVFAGGGAKAKKQAIIRSVPRVRVIPDQPQSVEWYGNIGYRLENFFTLCLGGSVHLRQVQLFRGDKDGWIIQHVRQRNEKFNFQMMVRCSSAAMEKALDVWLAVPEEKRPVEKTVLGILRKSSVYVETEFLSLAQALEGFHRLKGTDKTFSERIKDVYDMLGPAFALKLLGDKDEFARKVVQTRNFFTHLGISAGNDVVQDAGDIFDLNQRLHALIRCVMLIQLGISETDLTEPILYHASRYNLR